MSSTALPRFKILAAALLFSTGGMAIKSCGLTSWQVASFRSFLAALAMLVLLKAARQRFSLATLGVGVFYAATLVCYVLANKTTTAANAIFLQSTAPLYILLLAPPLLGERSRPRDVLVIAALALGLGLFFFGEEQASATAPAPALGNLLGAASGLAWAFTVMGMRWLDRHGDGRLEAPAAVVAGNLLAGLVCLPMALPVAASEPTDWLWLAYLGIFQVGVAYVFLSTAIGQVPALETSLLLLVEPIWNPVWAFLVHREMPGPLAITGGVLIVVVTVLKSFWDRKSRGAKSEAAGA